MISKRILGRTNLEVSILGIGGYHIGITSEKEGIKIIQRAIDEGINFMDNAWCYNSGESEIRMGKALKGGYREKVILMTKNHGRDAKTFAKQLDESLKRLQTDYIDILQFHEIISEEIPNQIFTQGAIEEALKAKEKGKIRFIGFTGHKDPKFFKQMLNFSFEWDTVQMPVNLLDYHYNSFTKQILPILNKRNIGIIAMKSLGGSHQGVLKAGISVKDAISYTLSQNIDVLVSGITNLNQLKENLEIAKTFKKLAIDEKQKLLEKVRPLAQNGRLEWYKM